MFSIPNPEMLNIQQSTEPSKKTTKKPGHLGKLFLSEMMVAPFPQPIEKG